MPPPTLFRPSYDFRLPRNLHRANWPSPFRPDTSPSLRWSTCRESVWMATCTSSSDMFSCKRTVHHPCESSCTQNPQSTICKNPYPATCVEHLRIPLTGCRMCLELPSSKQGLICLRRFTLRIHTAQGARLSGWTGQPRWTRYLVELVDGLQDPPPREALSGMQIP